MADMVIQKLGRGRSKAIEGKNKGFAKKKASCVCRNMTFSKLGPQAKFLRTFCPKGTDVLEPTRVFKLKLKQREDV